jgi:hypothetical protein
MLRPCAAFTLALILLFTLEEARALFLAPDWTREYLRFFELE